MRAVALLKHRRRENNGAKTFYHVTLNFGFFHKLESAYRFNLNFSLCWFVNFKQGMPENFDFMTSFFPNMITTIIKRLFLRDIMEQQRPGMNCIWISMCSHVIVEFDVNSAFQTLNIFF